MNFFWGEIVKLHNKSQMKYYKLNKKAETKTFEKQDNYIYFMNGDAIVNKNENTILTSIV